MNILIMGAPGVGKGTQSEIISEKYGIPTISTGAILRREIANGTPLGVQAKGLVESGKLVPDELITEMVATRLKESDCAKGFILDGYPRTMEQAKSLEEMNIHIDRVLLMEVPDDTIIERLSGRRICDSCGANFHLKYNPSTAGADKCDQCGGKLVERKDDEASTVKKRLESFHQTTKGVVDYYGQQGLLLTIDANASVSDTTDRTIRALEAAK